MMAKATHRMFLDILTDRLLYNAPELEVEEEADYDAMLGAEEEQRSAAGGEDAWEEDEEQQRADMEADAFAERLMDEGRNGHAMLRITVDAG